MCVVVLFVVDPLLQQNHTWYHTWYNTRNAAVLAVIVFDRTGRSFRTGVCVRNTPQQRLGFYQDRTGRSLRTGVRKQRGFQMI